ncbi:hypothetical protein ACQEU6_08930 [Spirillospora sp. CA-108201]
MPEPDEQYDPDEMIEVTLKPVRVHRQGPDGTVTIKVPTPDGGTAHWPLPPQAEIKRVAPADWPPQDGDVWGDRHDRDWFAVTPARLLPASGGREEHVSDFLRKYGPPELRYRKSTDADEPDCEDCNTGAGQLGEANLGCVDRPGCGLPPLEDLRD